jgi:hypothetical protein
MIDAVLTFTISLDPAAFMALLIVSALLCLISLPVGFYFIRHGRIMQDTPTSKIRSASQGFVELEGQARSIDDKPLKAPGTLTDCVWYDFKAEKHQDTGLFDRGNRKGKWITVSEDRSPFSFYIDDGTGVCAIDPDAATVKAKFTKVWTQGKYRYTESRIDEREKIYCLGQFETSPGPSRQKVIKESARVALNQIKKDRNELLRQFDANGDGEIDLDEWNIARSAARVQAEKEVDDDYEPTQHHVLVKPFNRKNPYIVSCFGEDELTSRYRLYSAGSFVTFLITGVYSIIMIIIRWGI